MAKGGSRFGAGRPGYKIKGEQLQRIDIREFARRGMLESTGSYTWSWNRGGEPTGSVDVSVYPQSEISLNYTVTLDGQSGHISDRVHLIYRPCNFGGARPWFGCPRCARKVAVLYLRVGRFACRHCQSVAYSSQAENVMARMWRKQYQLEEKLGDYWQRPKGMRLRTYERLMDRLAETEQRRETAFCLAAQRLFGTLQKIA